MEENYQLIDTNKSLRGDVAELKRLVGDLCQKVKETERYIDIAEKDSKHMRQKVAELTERCKITESTASKQRKTDKRLNALIVKKAREADLAKQQEARVVKGCEQMLKDMVEQMEVTKAEADRCRTAQLQADVRVKEESDKLKRAQLDIVALNEKIRIMDQVVQQKDQETSKLFQSKDMENQKLSAEIETVRAENEYLRQIQRRHDDELREREEKIQQIVAEKKEIKEEVLKWTQDYETTCNGKEKAEEKMKTYKDQLKEIERVRRLEHITVMDMRNKLRQANLLTAKKSSTKRGRRRRVSSYRN